MVRLVKFLFPFAQLAFAAWVIWTANTPQWQTVFGLLALASLAISYGMMRFALVTMLRAHRDPKLAEAIRGALDTERVTKPRYPR